MEPTLLVIGVSWRTAPIAVRERFCMDAPRRRQALEQLARSEGVREAVVLATCERTEAILWAQDASLAAGSVLNFLTHEYGLRSSDWRHFYRLLDERALLHLMRAASGLDSMVAGDPQILLDLQAAWTQSQAAAVSASFLDAVFANVLAAGARVRDETGLGASVMSVPCAAVELARQIFGSLEKCRVLLAGAGRVAGQVAERLAASGAGPVCVMSRTFGHAAELAARVRAGAAPLQEMPQHLAEADVVIAAAAAPEFLIARAAIEAACCERHGRPLLLVDLGLPRNIDPAARELPDVFLHDLDGLTDILERAAGEARQRSGQADPIIASEARRFCSNLQSQCTVPLVVALREKLDAICRQELELFCRESGPFPGEQALETFACRLSQRLAGSLARELKEHPDSVEQEHLTQAVQRLFRLEDEAAAGTGS